ncbi:MAG: hypothetical protein Q9P90_16315 [candidate division KSB1 bacterium]|nr:hypothetical protein [candidate division KSB1 bacterium]
MNRSAGALNHPWKMAILIAVIRWLMLGALVAQEKPAPPVEVTSSVNRSQITIGDLIHYRIRVSRAPQVKVEWPSPGSNLGAFEIRDYALPEPREENGRIIEEMEYTISTFDTGAFVIPPIEVRYAMPPDTARYLLKTEPIEIYVASLKPSLEGDIRGLKPQGVLPRDWRRILMYAGIALLVITLGVGAWFYWRYRKRGALPFVKPEPPRPAHEIALEALKALEAEQLLAQGQVKEHFSRLADILRAYLENRYFMPALESTTFEIVQHFSNDGRLGGQLEPLEKVLNLCDLVKFAKYIPGDDEADEAMRLSYAFIEATRELFSQPENGRDAGESADANATNPENATKSVSEETGTKTETS